MVTYLNLEQGSQEWLDIRKSHFCASEAAAMMGASRHLSRNQLLDQKKGAVTPEVSNFQKSLFEKGHAAEADARKILFINTLDEFEPKVARRLI